MNILLFSDIHYGNYFYYKKELVPTKHLKHTLNLFMSRIDDYNPTLLINLGDLIQSYSYNEDTKNLKEVISLFRKKNIRVLHTIGNHDVEYIPKEEWLKQTNLDSSFYHVSIGKIIFIFLDTTFKINNLFYVNDQQIKWLKKLLEKDSLFYIFSHHPLVDYNINKNFWFKNDPLKAKICNGNSLTHILEKHRAKIIAVFSSHLHAEYHIISNGIKYYSLPALFENVNNTKRKGLFYNHITIKGSIYNMSSINIFD